MPVIQWIEYIPPELCILHLFKNFDRWCLLLNSSKIKWISIWDWGAGNNVPPRKQHENDSAICWSSASLQAIWSRETEVKGCVLCELLESNKLTVV